MKLDLRTRMTNKQSLRLLVSAAERGEYKTFLGLVTPSKVNEFLVPDYTALILLVEYVRTNDSPEIFPTIDQLLSWGANINAQNNEGWSALHKATNHQNAKLVAHLLERGANMRLKSRWADLTSIQQAFDPGCCELFLLRGAKPQEFAAGCYRRNKTRDGHIEKFYTRIVNARRTVTTFLGIYKNCRLLQLVGKDITLQLAKTIYQTRGNLAWDP